MDEEEDGIAMNENGTSVRWTTASVSLSAPLLDTVETASASSSSSSASGDGGELLTNSEVSSAVVVIIPLKQFFSSSTKAGQLSNPSSFSTFVISFAVETSDICNNVSNAAC